MTIKIGAASSPLSEKDISEVETQIGKKFPEQYREFLLKNNGGHPDLSAFKIKWKSDQDWAEGYDFGLLEYFLAIDPDRSADFMDYYDTFDERIPSSTIAIGFDPGGNLVLLGTEADNKGKVYFWMHSYETDEDDEADYSNVGFIAESFKEFLDGLYDAET